MAIARNKKPDPAAIAAFGAAAEYRPDEPASPAPPAPTPAAAPSAPAARDRKKPAANAPSDGPMSTLVRWKGAEDVRDRIKSYAKTERYSEQDVAIQALRHGLDYLESQLNR